MLKTKVAPSKTNASIDLDIFTNNWTSSWTSSIRKKSLDNHSRRFWTGIIIFIFEKSSFPRSKCFGNAKIDLKSFRKWNRINWMGKISQRKGELWILVLNQSYGLWIYFKFGKEFPEECLYIVIKAEEAVKNGLSGKYYFHSMHKNVGVYIREPKRVPGQESTEVNRF